MTSNWSGENSITISNPLRVAILKAPEPALGSIETALIASVAKLESRTFLIIRWSGTPIFPFPTEVAFRQIEIPSEFSPFPPTMPASQIMRMLGSPSWWTLRTTEFCLALAIQSQVCPIKTWPFFPRSEGMMMQEQASAFAKSTSLLQFKVRMSSKLLPEPSAMPFISSTYGGQYFSITGRNFMASFCACGQSIFADFSNAEE